VRDTRVEVERVDAPLPADRFVELAAAAADGDGVRGSSTRFRAWFRPFVGNRRCDD
jgi:hypothetical protein